MAVDTEGSPIVLRVHRADVQDRDGAPDVIVEFLCKAPQVSRLFADGGYAGPRLRDALADLGVWELIEIGENRNTSGSLRFSTGDGWWGGPLPGWADAGVWRRTSSAPRRAPWRGQDWPHAGSSRAGLAGRGHAWPNQHSLQPGLQPGLFTQQLSTLRRQSKVGEHRSGQQVGEAGRGAEEK